MSDFMESEGYDELYAEEYESHSASTEEAAMPNKVGEVQVAATHTPGPWKACGDGKCSCRQVWSIPGDCPVFTARPDGSMSVIGLAHHKWGDSPDLIYGDIPPDEQQANAMLIASAPDLLLTVAQQAQQIATLTGALEKIAQKREPIQGGMIPTASALIARAALKEPT